jgi:L-alanine-DL-glutamate epimerase-like enolase superfamily enzyme
VAVFRIAYKTQTHAQTIVVELQEGEWMGRGEALGVSYHGETADSLLEQLTAVSGELRNGPSREELQDLLPPGGARQAIDCALWDLEAKRQGRRAWELADIHGVQPLLTSLTLGLDTPEAMGRTAAAQSRCAVLKLKLDGTCDLERVTEVRRHRPDAQIIVDANQSWREDQLSDLIPRFAALGVTLIEQPLPPGKDDALLQFKSDVPLCADESCQTTASLPALLNKYQYVNIKLDKTGGLTEGLRLARAARAQGFRLMVGCMGGSSLSMAPGFVVGQLCELVDLDGPLLLKSDVPDAMTYDGGRVSPPGVRLWG